MRRFSIMSFACVVVLVALAAGMAVASPHWEVGIYYWPPGSDPGADIGDPDYPDLKIEEDVAWVDPDTGAEIDLGDPGIWEYRYNVTNLDWDEDVTAWGYVMPGIGFTYADAPPGWSYGAAGMDVGWTWDGLDPDEGPIADSLNTFKIWSEGAPHHLYWGTAIGDGCGPEDVSGWVSGPTPEPITMALLALGLPLGLLARRRRRDE